ncbi:hypothetical protein Ahy_B05g077686 isoform B [Arachis hypogaea]|uniref:Isopentenyl phosphate kinase n=1 Tax=Arachis hypogaea TaxID=3818 RepID=A0A444Z5D6_ARAHY|nr:hypothetical protein Ahy_B05g077686 isoform B [Arachis hypogaea]
MDLEEQQTLPHSPFAQPIRCIVKLGGAAITCKNELEMINDEILHKVSEQLRQAMISSSQKPPGMDWSKRHRASEICCNPDEFKDHSVIDCSPFIVVHGAGSFGHFQASKSGVHKGQLNKPIVKGGFVATRISVTTLNLAIVRALARGSVITILCFFLFVRAQVYFFSPTTAPMFQGVSETGCKWSDKLLLATQVGSGTGHGIRAPSRSDRSTSVALGMISLDLDSFHWVQLPFGHGFIWAMRAYLQLECHLSLVDGLPRRNMLVNLLMIIDFFSLPFHMKLFVYIHIQHVQISSGDLSSVAKAIESGFTPVLHGDAVFDDIQGCSILSGDVIISHLAAYSKPKYVVFMTDVYGVYDRPPTEPDAMLLKEIAVAEDGSWSVINPKLQNSVELTVAAHDTTGGMETKISEAAMIAKLGIDVYIVKAATSHSLRALSGVLRSSIPNDWLGTVVRSSR